MPIEGPLRELGIQDVFQLLDLSRKTGVLRIASKVRDDEGVVYFDSGRVVQASIRSRATPLEVALLNAGRVSTADIETARARASNGDAGRPIVDLLVDGGAISQKDLDRHLRQQIERVVFDLMEWSEGFFSFEERPRDELDVVSRVAVSTESLLMESARRIDEWSRIADVVPNLEAVPELAPVEAARHGAMLDLLPHEWQVLTIIDGITDLRGIAAAVRREEFEVAKIVYGMATTGILTIRGAARKVAEPEEESHSEASIIAARTLTRAGRYTDALETLRRAVQRDPLTPRVHLELGCAAARAGDLALARSSWDHVLRLAAEGSVGQWARDGLDALNHFERVLAAQLADVDG